MELNLILDEAVEVLERGHDCARSARAARIIERCLDRGKKTIKVVAVESVRRHPEEQDVWLITHVGLIGRRR
jgi:hypothetical protein